MLINCALPGERSGQPKISKSSNSLCEFEGCVRYGGQVLTFILYNGACLESNCHWNIIPTLRVKH